MKFSNRILSFLLAVVIVFSMIPVHAHAEVGGDWEYTITDDQVTITGYTGSESEVVIPATIEDKPVVGIGSSAFMFNKNLTSVTIPESVENFGECVFMSCSNLSAIVVDENNPYFSSDDRGVLFDKNKTVLIAAPGAISGEYTIPNTVTTIGSCAFQACANLTGVTIPDSVTVIDGMAFESCSSLATVTIPAGVTEIVTTTFAYCSSLDGIWVDENNPYMSSDDRGVLFNKDKTQLIMAPMTLSGAYTIPSSVTAISESAFQACASITSVVIPSGVTTIDNYTFISCDALKYAVIPSSVTTINEYAFNVSGLKHVLYTGTEEQWNAMSIDESNGQELDVAIIHYECDGSEIDENGVCSICPAPDPNLEGLTYFLDEGAITITGYDGSLSELTIPSTIDGYTVGTIHGFAFSYSGGLTSVTIPDSVTSMGEGVFYGCSNLTSVTLPAGLTSINNCMFQDCIGLTDVTIPASVTSIGNYAFYACNSMTSLILPAGVTSIGDSALDCGDLQHVLFKGTEAQWNAIDISSDSAYLTDAIIHYECTGNEIDENGVCSLCPTDPCASGHDYQDGVCVNCSLLEGMTYEIENDQVIIDEYTGSLTELTIPATIEGKPVVGIAGFAFAFNQNLTSVTIPKSVKSVDATAFKECSNLPAILVDAKNPYLSNDDYGVLFNKDMTVLVVAPAMLSGEYTIPDTVETIGADAFTYCTGLTSVVIPDSVTSIGEGAFMGCYTLTSVTIPAGVANLSSTTFDSCFNLTGIWVNEENPYLSSDTHGVLFNKNKTTLIAAPAKLSVVYTIPSSVTTIEEFALQSCANLTGVVIPSSVTTIGYGAFACCSSLDHVLYADSEDLWNDVSIGDNNDYLTGATIHYNATGDEIDENGVCSLCPTDPCASGHDYQDGVCVNCSLLEGMTYEIENDQVTITGYSGSLTSMIIPSTIMGSPVVAIGDYAFADNTNLITVSIPDCVETIDERAFYNCSNMIVVGIGNAVETIGAYAFYNCLSLEGVVIGNNVSSIGEYAFGYCPELTDVTLPDEVTNIGMGAFAECGSLINITIGSSVQTIGESAFANTDLRHVLFTGTEEQWKEITIGSYNDTLTDAIIHYNCTGDEIDENGVCSICPAPDDSENWEYTITDDEVTITGYIGDQVEITIPETIEGLPVVAIGEEAFFDRRDLSSVTISDSVEIIGDAAFSACTNLENIVLGESVTTIGAYAFSDCSSLTSFYIPASVTDVSNGAFNNCVGIPAFTVDENNNVFSTDDTGVLFSKDKGVLVAAPASISGAYTIPNGVISISTQAFSECRNLTSVTMPDTVTDIGSYAFGYCENLQSITLSKNLTTTAAYAFSNCTSLTSITIPDSVDWITVGTFENCESLTSIVIPNAVIYIGDDTFSGCSKLSSVTMGTGVQMIDSNAFSGCTSLTSVTMPDSLSVLGTGVFKDCSNLEKVTLSKNLTSIPEYTFYNCNKLSSITIPNSVQEIGEEAFFQCVELTNVVIPDGVAQIGASAFMFCTSLNNVVIPGSVQTIGDYAFNTCTSLKNLTIENGVKTIAGGAFYCSGLTKVSLPNSVTSIGDYAFSECVYLETITIGNGVKTIGEDAICEEKLHHVLYTGTEAQWNAISIDDTNELTDVIIHYNCTGNEIDEDGTCSACNPCAAGHDYQKKVDKQYQVSAATCTAAATYYKSCSRCGKASTTKFTSGEKLGHKWSSWVETKPATTTSTGQQKRTCQRSGCDHSETKTIAKLIAPVVTASNVASTGKVKLTWNKIDGASKYEVYRATSKTGTYSRITTVTGTSVTNTSAVAGKTYYYKVRAVLSAGAADSDIVSRTCDLAQPEVTASNVASTGKVKLTWEKVEGAAKYEVYRATSKTGTYSRITTVTGTSVTNTSAVAGKTYYYKVKAIHDTNSAATSAESVVVNRTCDLAQPKVTATNVTTSGKVKLTWEKVEGAAKYEVYRATSETGTYSRITTVTGTSVTNTSTTAGKTYYYKVRAIHSSNSAATSAYSSIVNRTCDLAQPRVTATNVESTGKVKLTWEKVEGATKYEVYRATSKTGTYSRITTVTGTSVTNTSATAGKTYYYKVRAIHGTNSSANSAYSTIVNRTCDLARPDVTAKLSSGNVKLSWEKISGASKYEVYRATSKTGTYSKLTTITGTTYTDKSVKAGKTYYYKVRAIHSSSSANSVYSTIDSVAVK